MDHWSLAGGLAALIASATDAIVTADETGTILTWNPAAERVFGYAAREVVGEPLKMLVPERFRAAHEAGLARVAAGGEQRVIGQTVDLAALRRDGVEFPVELSLSTWVEGERRFFAGIIRDITERRRLSDTLAESEARLAAILRSAVDAVICADERGVIILWNHAATRILGYRESEMVGQPLTAIIPERFHDAHEAGILRMSCGGAPRIIGQIVEVYAATASGREIPVELSLATWTTDDDRFYCGILRDISERRRAEDALEASAAALADKNRQLERLSAQRAE